MTTKKKNDAPVIYPGGETPAIGDLFKLTMDEFMQNIGPYALAGVGIMLASIPIVFITIIVTYILLIVGVFGSVMGLSAAAIAILPEDLMFLGPMAGGILAIVFIFVAITFLMSGINALLAPFNASLVRAVAAHQRGEQELTLGAAFSTMTQNLLSVMGTAILLSIMASMLAAFCYLPMLLVPLFFAFAPGLVALYGIKAFDAIKGAGGHAKRHLKWHGLYMLTLIGANLLASNIPVIGPAFMSALHVRAMRMVFGDGEFPNLAVVD